VIPHIATGEAVEAVDTGRMALAVPSSEVAEACRHLAEEGMHFAAAFRAVKVVGCVPSATAVDDRAPCRLAGDAGGIGWQADCRLRPPGSVGQRSRGRTFGVI
jgi:hypothetical protein